MKYPILLCLGLVIGLGGSNLQSAERYMSDEAIWNACWSDYYDDYSRKIHYPSPIQVTIHNISKQTWHLCVFDNLCPYTLFKGDLRPKHSITVTACGDSMRRGSISMMNSEGYIWFYDDTRDRTITLK
jgi:hypothetical protein